MKRIQYQNYGGPDVMKLESFTLASPGPREVAVKVRFAAINPIDWKLRSGQMKIVTGRSFPRAMGMDFSGSVIAVGSDVTRFKVGDAVFGLARFKESGALAEAVVTQESLLSGKPDDVSFEQAACLGTPGMTAWNGLRDKARLSAGQHVFINGCSGAVGEACVQIARMIGAKVSGSCSEQTLERARRLGVDTVYDYQKTDLSHLPERFDVVYDTAATMPLSLGFSLLRKGGVLLDLNPSPGKFIRALFDKRLKPVICTPRPDVLDTLAQAAQNGSFRLPVAEVVPLGDAIQLIAAIEGGRKLRGKALVAMD
ncbi:Quinone oxidoreductase 1 [Pseudomonas ogarae]|uniref:NAD(P)-dependent alcohol dehydrogenase n=1 Tax=Pseudomonas ogarae (strain DSM 112162 / CECT 30235 / F113) TaxID=1114970 RepID=UPI000BB37909|nr:MULTISPECIES: NAD(P)-dependent alcohol dehydrogenase [Pseudomonas]PBJ03471.1 Quinone oxidoreductase 1 [Pseudomonas ogarae]QXH92311.1 NAD(P)-dependent alcohol dehydrogenase [Pseudomonas zarinae]